MKRPSLLKRISILIVFIFLLNLLANKLYLYSGLWYFDILMHFIGGFWLGLVVFWFYWPEVLTVSFIKKAIFWVLLVGVGWEIFELVFVNYIALNDFNIIDTSADICFDLAGGLWAILYCEKKIINSRQSAI